MINVKISMSSHGENLDFINFYSSGTLPKVNFYINNEIEKADFWFVFEDLKYEQESCFVPKDNIFYLNNETSFKKDYFFENHMVKFLDQFNKTFGCYSNNNINHVNTLPFLPWMIHGNHGDIIFEKSDMNFETLKNLSRLEKSVDLSVICSNKSHTENHQLRLEFVKTLKNYFGDKLAWHGNGINPINQKSDIIFKSKYHIVLENDMRYNLVSEKLYDSFLGLSFPIYYGAPNIHEYFVEDSLIAIDINDINSSIKKIQEAIKNNLYENNYEKILHSRDKVLNELNLHNRLISIVENYSNQNHINSEKVTLYSSNYFWKKHTSIKKKIKKELKRKFRLN